MRKLIALRRDHSCSRLPQFVSAVAAVAAAAAAGGLVMRDGVAAEVETHGEAILRGPGI